MKFRSREAGFTMMELLLSVSVTAFASIWIVQWLNKPALLQGMMLNTDRQRQLTHATSVLTNDLMEADPASIAWTQLPPLSLTPNSSITFWKLNYDLNNPGSVQQTNFQYQFQPDSAGSTTGALVRIVTQGATTLSSTVVISPIDAPGVTAPSFVQADKADASDTNYTILILTVQYHPLNAAPISVVRRISMTM